MEMVAEKTDKISAIMENFQRGFHNLETEIKSYPNDWNLWIREGDIKNSAGSLCLYLVNLFHHALHVMGGNEFYSEIEPPAQELSRADLLNRVQSVKSLLKETMEDLSDDILEEEFPLVIRDKPVSTTTYLLYLVTELYYHVGQINYHRRLI